MPWSAPILWKKGINETSQVAAFQQTFLLISLLYLATIIPALLTVPPKREKVGGLYNE